MTRQDDLGSLVIEEDLDLGLLSEEELEALWADRTLATTGTLRPDVFVALKSLLSSERAQLEDGEITLGGFLGVIRSVADDATKELGVETEDGDPFTWMASGPVVLERSWKPPGLLRFVLRSRSRALSELVTELISPSAPRGIVTFTVHDLADGPADGPAQDVGPSEPQLVLVLGADGSAMLSGGADDGRPVDRLALRQRLQELLD